MKCNNCKAEMEFDSEKERYECKICGNAIELSEEQFRGNYIG